MASGRYRFYCEDTLGTTTVAWTTKDYRMLLLNASGTLNQAHRYVSDISANEISAAGYSRQTLGTKSVGWDVTNTRSYVTSAAAVWSSLATGQTVGSAVIYEYNAADSAARLVCFIDFTDFPTNGSSFTLTPDATDGWFYI